MDAVPHAVAHAVPHAVAHAVAQAVPQAVPQAAAPALARGERNFISKRRRLDEPSGGAPPAPPQAAAPPRSEPAQSEQHEPPCPPPPLTGAALNKAVAAQKQLIVGTMPAEWKAAVAPLFTTPYWLDTAVAFTHAVRDATLRRRAVLPSTGLWDALHAVGPPAAVRVVILSEEPHSRADVSTGVGCGAVPPHASSWRSDLLPTSTARLVRARAQWATNARQAVAAAVLEGAASRSAAEPSAAEPPPLAAVLSWKDLEAEVKAAAAALDADAAAFLERALLAPDSASAGGGSDHATPNASPSPAMRRGMDTTLRAWMAQGVLPLHARLTVEEGSPESHAQIAWTPLVIGLINAVVAARGALVASPEAAAPQRRVPLVIVTLGKTCADAIVARHVSDTDATFAARQRVLHLSYEALASANAIAVPKPQRAWMPPAEFKAWRKAHPRDEGGGDAAQQPRLPYFDAEALQGICDAVATSGVGPALVL